MASAVSAACLLVLDSNINICLHVCSKVCFKGMNPVDYHWSGCLILKPSMYASRI